jgi:hypothetical protein
MNRRRSFFYALAIVVSLVIAITLRPWTWFHHGPKTFVAWSVQLQPYQPGPEDEPRAMYRLKVLPQPDWSQPALLAKIPSVILTAKGAYINGGATPLPFDAVISTLANYPESAWPCGRLIHFVPFQPGAPEQSAPSATVKKIMAKLKEAGIAYPSITGKD